MEREANERKVYMSDCINYSRLEMYIFSLELDKYQDINHLNFMENVLSMPSVFPTFI